MAIPSRQIGWSTQDNLLWQIAKQMEQLSCQLCNVGIPGPQGPPGPAGTLADAYHGAFIFDSATTLTAPMNSNGTSPVQVVSTAGFYAPGYIRIGTEIIAYTGISGNTFTGITRGVASSGGSNHNIGDGVAQAQYTAADVPKQVLLDQTDLSNGVTLNPLTGDVTIVNAGTYNLQFSIQFENFSNDVEDAIVWFTLNGNDIPKTASYITTPTIHGGTPGATLMTVNVFLALSAGDVVALEWTSNQGKTAITSIPPVGSTIPQSPGVIFTVNRIA